MNLNLKSYHLILGRDDPGSNGTKEALNRTIEK